MNKYKRYIPVVALVLIALGVNLDQFGIDLNALSRGADVSLSGSANSGSATESARGDAHTQPSDSKWSNTNPEINLWHIFEGEINRRGKPVGFHSRPDGRDPANARLVSMRDGPNRAGVYTATIEIRDGNEWKSKFSSFFPDSLSREEVVDAVLNAYNRSSDKNAEPFEGPSGLGFTIQGYTSSRGGINTAFPVYVNSQ